MNESVYELHHDDGHGWLQVSIETCKELGVIDQISQFSYVNLSSHLLYLEEDLDADLFIDRFIQQRGYKPQIAKCYNGRRSSIRNLRNFTKEIKDSLT